MNSQLQVNATIRSINRNDVNTLYTFYIVTVSEGTWTVENLNSIPQIGLLSKEDILNSKKSPMIDYKSTDSIYGGKFGDRIKKFGMKTLAGLRAALPYVKDVATTIGPFLPLLGLGEDEHAHMDHDGGVLMGANKKILVRGGKAISRKELHKRLS